MSKKNRFKIEEISRFIVYVLGHKPYEFGLVPDKDGYVNIKEFLQAVHEEPGWGYIRQGHINEIMLSRNRSLFQMDDKRIRTKERDWVVDLDNPSQILPKILYIAIRRRSHAFVFEKGLNAKGKGFYILSHDKEMAKRIGRRKDNNPVILEVMSDKALKEGISFFTFGELFLTIEIQPRYIAGPPVPKAMLKDKEEKAPGRERKAGQFETGTFVLDQNRDMDLSRRSKGKKKKSWKEEARKSRRNKKGYP